MECFAGDLVKIHGEYSMDFGECLEFAGGLGFQEPEDLHLVHAGEGTGGHGRQQVRVGASRRAGIATPCGFQFW